MVLCGVIHCNTVLGKVYGVMWCCVVLYGVIQCYVVLYGVIQCYVVLYGIL